MWHACVHILIDSDTFCAHADIEEYADLDTFHAVGFSVSVLLEMMCILPCRNVVKIASIRLDSIAVDSEKEVRRCRGAFKHIHTYIHTYIHAYNVVNK